MPWSTFFTWLLQGAIAILVITVMVVIVGATAHAIVDVIREARAKSREKE